MSTVPSTPVRVIDRGTYALTNYRALCRRGVLWIGQTCNLRCHFCYFLDKIMDRNHPEHDFFELDKLKAMCKTLVDVYGNNSVDIQGGEPTIYRHITQLIHYCNEIGLKPTLITNGQVLANPENGPRIAAWLRDTRRTIPRRNRSSISKAASSSAAPGDSTSLRSDANPTTSCRSRRS